MGYCSGCQKNRTSRKRTTGDTSAPVTYAEAVKIRAEKQGYTRTSTFTKGVQPNTKAAIRAKNRALLTGK